MFKVNLETERIRIRNLIPQDIDFMIKLWTDPDVTEYMGGARIKEKLVANLKEDLQNPYKNEYDLWIIEDKVSMEPIGNCGLLEKQVDAATEIEVVYILDKSCWGRGLATEAASEMIRYGFENKGLKGIIALIKPENNQSAKVAEKLGLTCEKKVERGEGRIMEVWSLVNMDR
jgi:ribosomal-protein-alanine N-acetyltransferase